MTVNTFFGESMQNVGRVVMIHARGTGAGAANLTSVKGNGITSITRTGVGTHRITLARKFQGLLNVIANIIDVTTPDDWEVNVLTDLTSNQTIDIAIYKSGAAAELTSDEKLLLTLVLQDTSAKPAGF